MSGIDQYFSDVTVMCREINRQVRTGEILTLSEEEGTRRVMDAVNANRTPSSPSQTKTKNK